MTPILDRVAASMSSAFRPSNPDEYFALRLAAKLGEPQTAGHFAMLLSQHGHDKLVSNFHQTMADQVPGEDLGRRFLAGLAESSRSGSRPAASRLVAIRIERRSVAAAVFNGTNLIGLRVRQLSSKPPKADASAPAFIRLLIREFHFESAAIEPIPLHPEIRRATLTQTVVDQLRTDGIPIFDVSKKHMIEAFSHPPLKTRGEVREVIARMWPQLSPKRGEICALDAVAIGIFLQTERVFNHYDSSP
jgi:hypothetical protein